MVSNVNKQYGDQCKQTKQRTMYTYKMATNCTVYSVHTQNGDQYWQTRWPTLYKQTRWGNEIKQDGDIW